MTDDRRRLGLAVIHCDGDAGVCPGLRDRLVINDPKNGHPPRGFFIRPRGRKLSEVEVVVIGQNPGAAGGFERHLNRVLVGRKDRFEIMSDAAIEAARELPYYIGLDLLVRNLWPDGRDRVLLATEVVYCESRRVPDPKKPGQERSMRLDDVIPFCTTRHLERQLACIPKKVTVICNGKVATDWFRGWAGRTGFKGLWMAVDHSSGSFTFKNLFDGRKLRPGVHENWKRLQRERVPLHLLKGTDLRQD